MPKIAHLGEIHDDVTYTHKRLAAIIGRDPDWVLDNLIQPEDPSKPGVRYQKVGTLYFISGEAVRFWNEEGARCHDGSRPKPR